LLITTIDAETQPEVTLALPTTNTRHGYDEYESQECLHDANFSLFKLGHDEHARIVVVEDHEHHSNTNSAGGDVVAVEIIHLIRRS
jgi:hypothetical protein